ncbi:unnamed protein product [Cylicocyclus nassatus]|uniref:Uncharacterized protein n=1 Tax=Cylicocyclus nassatus TaxID=53992 RepID=A0AA36H574_CYLNA|nr:unnamed protein product [Cylicocyclus nassatus]
MNHVNNSVDYEDNEIPLTYVNPHTQKKERDPADNRVGYTYKAKNDPRTDEGYKAFLKELSDYLKKFETQDHGYGHASPSYAYVLWECFTLTSRKALSVIIVKVILFTGSVHSRSIREVFESLFGSASDSEIENSIPYDDEDSNGKKHQETDRVNNSVDYESNEIPFTYVNPVTHTKERDPADNRVGYIYEAKNDPRTDEGYNALLKELADYLHKFANQDHGYGIGETGYAHAGWKWLVHHEHNELK